MSESTFYSIPKLLDSLSLLRSESLYDLYAISTLLEKKDSFLFCLLFVGRYYPFPFEIELSWSVSCFSLGSFVVLYRMVIWENGILPPESIHY